MSDGYCKEPCTLWLLRCNAGSWKGPVLLLLLQLLGSAGPVCRTDVRTQGHTCCCFNTNTLIHIS
jgi:hypothetical protein